jgi:hypothetical protein
MPELQVTTLTLTALILSFVIWRVTRFLLRDSMFEETRFKVEHFFGSRANKLLPRKINELITCPWCVSIWVSAGLTALWRWQEGDGVGWFWTAVVWLASAGAAMAWWLTWEVDE